MQEQDRDPIVAICLLAAMADGERSVEEQAQFHSIAVRLGADLNGGVAFYGRQAGADDVPKISAPLLLHYAGNDQGVNAGIANYEAALKANSKLYSLHMYEGKQHGFHNDTTPRYDESSAKLAWARSLEFFNKYLR